MLKIKYLRVFFGLLVLGGIATYAPWAEARTRKGDRFLKDGKAAESRGDWDTALANYEQAINQDPNDTGYMIAMRRARFEAGQQHVNAGLKLRNEGKLEEAMQEFQKALVADPSSAIALQEIRRTQDMIRNPQASNDRNLTPADRARKASTEQVEAMLPPPELKPMTQVIPTIRMNNQPVRILYETVGRLGGVNVVFDPRYVAPMRNFNVDLSNATIEQGFDYLALLTHTFWKPISQNTIFVTEDNVTNRRDYEDDVVKVFYVTNATSVQEFQEIATAIRTVAEIRRVFTYNAQRAMIVRDTVDKVALAEKLVHDLDKPKSEVVVDVMVMEANSERTRDLAATIASATASGITAGISVPVTFGAPTTTSSTTPNANGTTTPTTTSNNSISLGQIPHLSIDQFNATLPGGLLQALLADTNTKVLNKPQVRASDGQKVTLKIGNRIPYATGSFQTNTAAALVSTQFNYADVGVNIDMTPQVHSHDEVTMHVEVTVSSVQNYVQIGGIAQPVIGQRSNITDIRLREGEVNILGGLSSAQDTLNVNGIPGLVNVPVLGHVLFGSEHNDRTRGELLIVLIPHIVRTPDYTAENLRGIYAGTDQVVKINYAARSDGNTPAAPSAPAPGAAPVPPPPPGNPAPPQAILAPNPPAPGAARVSFLPAAIQTNPGGSVSVTVQVAGANDLMAASPLRIKYDASKLRLDDITPGDLFMRGGVNATAEKDIRNDTGDATITITRPNGSPAVSGDGAVAVLRFTAVASGTANVTVSEAGLMNSRSQAVPATAAETTVRIQ